MGIFRKAEEDYTTLMFIDVQYKQYLDSYYESVNNCLINSQIKSNDIPSWIHQIITRASLGFLHFTGAQHFSMSVAWRCMLRRAFILDAFSRKQSVFQRRHF